MVNELLLRKMQNNSKNNLNKNPTTEFIYTIGKQSISDSHTLEKTTNERDLGIQLSNDLKWCDQSKYATNKANSVLGMLIRIR